jgi:hypothetical protein
MQPLIGDLLEQFADGRSTFWYWRQAVGVLAGNACAALRRHAGSFVLAILAGYELTSLWQLGCMRAFQGIYVNLAEVKRHPWTLDAFLRLAGMQADMACEFALYLCSAWLVTRVHRAHQRAVLVAFAAALMARHLSTIAETLSRGAAHTDFAVSLATQIILTALEAACILVAGLWMIRTKGFSRFDRRIRFVARMWIAQTFITGLLFAACRVGEIPYRRSEFYLSMYAAAAGCGLYLALLLWRQESNAPTRHLV